jgi:hypothetical protein
LGFWGFGGPLIAAKYGAAAAGTQNAGLAIARTNPNSGNSQEYNGTSWATGGYLITARGNIGGSGTQNAGLAFGGAQFGPGVTCTESYNGTSWSSSPAMSVARYGLGGAGAAGNSSALAVGGSGGNTNTEEYGV